MYDINSQGNHFVINNTIYNSHAMMIAMAIWLEGRPTTELSVSTISDGYFNYVRHCFYFIMENGIRNILTKTLDVATNYYILI